MKPIHLLLVVSSIVGALLAWHFAHRDSTPQAASINTDHFEPASIRPTAAEPPGLTEFNPGNQLTLLEPILPATEPETEQVLGFTVRRDRACSVEVHHVIDTESGRTTEALICAPTHPPEPDPYQTWDEETLAGMAYSDAHAAEVLGLRHMVSTDPQREALGLALLYRAAALSGSVAAFDKAVGQRYAYLSVNGEPQIHNLKQLLVFHRIGAVLEDPRARPGIIRRALLEAKVQEQELNALYRHIDQILETMAAVQTEATGDFTIREAIDNA